MIRDTLDKAVLEELQQKTADFLMRLVDIPSVSNRETEACEFCFEAFSQIPGVAAKKLPMDNSIKENPLWCCGPKENFDYTGHFNIEAVWKGAGVQEPIYLNAHVDTVEPVNDGLKRARLENGVVHGIGACDDKGPIASVYLILLILSRLGQKLPFDVVAHVVVEEEVGGNGALAATGRPMKGQAAIVLEPTDEKLYPVARCGLWLKMICHGLSAHTASIGTGGKSINAYDVVTRAIAVVKRVHESYQEECRQNPVRYYEGYTPTFNVGKVELGNWPSTVPNLAVAEMSVAVLPNSSNALMKDKIARAIDADEFLKDKVELRFVFDRECCVLPFDHPLVGELGAHVKANGYAGGVDSMKALSDAYFYNVAHNIPTVTYGPGSLFHAHAADEQVKLRDVWGCANAITDFIMGRATNQ